MQRIRDTLSGLSSEPKSQRFAMNVIVGFLPAVVMGLLFGKAIKAHLVHPGGGHHFHSGWFHHHLGRTHGQPSPKLSRPNCGRHDCTDALKVGLVQCLALVPGTSRSGATIIGGMMLGLSRQAATEFSFFLAIPTLIGAGAYSLYKERALLSMADLPLFSVGLAVSSVGFACVRWLIRYVSNHNFLPFAWYRLAFGALILITWYTGVAELG